MVVSPYACLAMGYPTYEHKKSEHQARFHLSDFKCNYSIATDCWAITNSSLVGYLLVSHRLTEIRTELSFEKYNISNSAITTGMQSVIVCGEIHHLLPLHYYYARPFV